jgi:chromatin segregation and condensation protein Rec8/ScpA/Scc1 (kleisin family)
MNEPFTHSPENASRNPDDLSESIKRISEKINMIQEAVKNMNHNRQQLEGKIEDAQKRVQRILSRLPDQGDTRQLNLLGEAIPPTNSEDDSEPTTH